jgi:hypothetical protein
MTAAITADLDDAAVLALNNAHAAETSHLTAAALRALWSQAFVAVGADRGASAFVIALDESAAYDYLAKRLPPAPAGGTSRQGECVASSRDNKAPWSTDV